MTTDRADPRQVGDLCADVEEAADPAGGRGVHHDSVVAAAPAAVLAPDGLGRLAGEQHVPQARRDRGGEVHHPELGQRAAGMAKAVEHLQVLDQGRFRVGYQREHVAARVRAGSRPDRDPSFLVWQRRHVEQLRDALAALDLHQQHPAAVGCQR